MSTAAAGFRTNSADLARLDGIQAPEKLLRQHGHISQAAAALTNGVTKHACIYEELLAMDCRLLVHEAHQGKTGPALKIRRPFSKAWPCQDTLGPKQLTAPSDWALHCTERAVSACVFQTLPTSVGTGSGPSKTIGSTLSPSRGVHGANTGCPKPPPRTMTTMTGSWSYSN